VTGTPPTNLEWRIRIFGVGAIVGLVGMWADQHWMVNLAIAVLGIGIALRFLRGPTPAGGPDEDLPEDDES
jgi:hypothetical protein